MPSILQTLKNRPLLLIGLIVAVALLIIFSPLLIVLLLAKTGSGVLLLKTVPLAHALIFPTTTIAPLIRTHSHLKQPDAPHLRLP